MKTQTPQNQETSPLSQQAQAYKTANPAKYAEMLELFDEATLSRLLAMPAAAQEKMLAPITFQQPKD